MIDFAESLFGVQVNKKNKTMETKNAGYFKKQQPQKFGFVAGHKKEQESFLLEKNSSTG